jgi:hypothetical protein
MTINQNTMTATSDDMYSHMDGYASQDMIPDSHTTMRHLVWKQYLTYWGIDVTLPQGCFWQSAKLPVACNSSLMHLRLRCNRCATYRIHGKILIIKTTTSPTT